jgi:hypothetical protein
MIFPISLFNFHMGKLVRESYNTHPQAKYHLTGKTQAAEEFFKPNQTTN